MQALKALVIFMGVLIVAGMALLVYGLVTRVGEEETAQTPPPAAEAPLAGFDRLDVAVPEGCRIAGAELSGTRLVLRFDGLPGRDCQQVVVVDMAGGRVLGRVRAVTEAQ